MLDHVEAERLSCFGDGFRVFMVVLQGSGNMGQVEITQAEVARRTGLSERAIRDHYKRLKADGVLERRRNGKGRVKFFVTPEFFWNYRFSIRNDHVQRRKPMSAVERARSAWDAAGVVEGGKS